MAKELTGLDAVLVETIKKATAVTGEAIDGAKKVTAQAIDFASAQIPDVIHQLIMWKLAEAAVWTVLGLSGLVIFAKLITQLKTKYSKEQAEHKHPDEGSYIFVGFLLTVILALPSTIIFVSYMMELLKIWLAPKVYLLEYAASLMK